MRLFWLQCALVSALVILYYPERCEGLTIKINLKEDVVLKITLVGKKKKNTTETNINLPYTDQEQWAKLRSNMIGNSSEANMNNATSVFDRIVITNAFARSASNDGRFLYQGDILMDASSFLPDKRRKKRAIIAFEYFRWNVEQGVPYKLHSTLDDASRRVILSAMREWEESLPCLKWRVKTDDDVDFVHFFKGDGCFSQVGKTGSGQSLSIGRGCAVHGIVLHEMGHALGIFHEQSRPDRDDYVKIVKDNILEGFGPQFEKFSEEAINSYNISYDYSSIMHYSATAFAKQKGLVTIEPRQKRDVKFGQRVHLSHSDIRQARAMYGCEDTEFIATPGSTTTTKPTTTPKPTTTREPTTSKATTTPQPTTLDATTAPEPTTNLKISSGTPPDDITEPTTSEKQTDAVTLQAITRPTESLITSTPDKPTIVTGVVETHELKTDAGVATTTDEPNLTTKRQTEPVTIPKPSAKPEKPEVCVDLLSTCYKWIRKDYCSPSSPNYCYMKYFCSRTCQIWRNSELSMGATCLNLLPGCEVKALGGQCTDLDNREYMENMCCESCRQANCIDEDPSCVDWAASGMCARKFPYLQRHCKKSCNFCDI